MSYELDSEVIETDAGPYTVRWIIDEDDSQPYDEGFGVAKVGDRNYIDVTHGEHADEILSLIRYHNRMNAYNGNIYDHEIRSSAALARYVRLKYGVQGVLAVGERFQTWQPSADRGERFYGLAWTDTETTGCPLELAERSTAASAQEWHAWAEGDMFGWVVEDPSGVEVESCWGFYGYDRERDYTRDEAKEAIAYDAQKRVEQANLVGAGIVGLV